ncbi:MAG: TolC family protein [Bacteroidales bacterium]|nr:TolC family protein [Bacteroidales bacterium]
MKALLIALALCAPAAGEETLPDLSRPWTLDECIDWAMEHNLTVASREAAVENSEIDKSTAIWSIAPSVSGSVSQNFNFGRGIGGDNTYESGNSSSTGFSLGAGMTLFDGLATPNRIKLASLNLDAATADLEKARDDVRIAVAKAYVQILYAFQIEEVAREQLSIDSLQVERLEGLFSEGAASAAEVSQQKASLAQSKLTLVQAGNSVREALLDLAQLLELPAWEGFSIVRPEVSVEDVYIGTPDDIYDDAVGLRPAVKAEKFRLEGMDRSIAIAKSAYYPSLSANAGLGTNYYSNFGGQGFWDQLNSNFSQYVGLSLNVPIFNRMATRNQVRSAKLNRRNQEIRLHQVQQSLYKEIQQAWNGAVAARAKYDASLDASAAAEDAFELTLAKYENGKATITEFNEARNRVVKARSDSVQATYEYLFQTRLVQFYRGGTLTL